MASANKVICAICYEEAKPVLEDLQSISQCGHVFHELCLQQWLEYHPPGRKSTCPLCKQQCSSKDAHRLYFQSSSDPTQLSPRSSCETPSSTDDVQRLQETVQKLTGQLSVTKSALEANQAQLQELNKDLSLCTVRAEKAEASRSEANKEKISLRDTLSRVQEDLKRSTSERCKLYEKNTALVKELASNKLFHNLDVDEDEVSRMAHVGCGNKDDVIGTLTRSLIIRNRAYKDLMSKCNELGAGESRAQRKADKAVERVRTLKARVQELEKILEDRENASLRGLKVPLDDTVLPNNKLLLKKKVVACRPGFKPVLSETIALDTSQSTSKSTSSDLHLQIEECHLKSRCSFEQQVGVSSTVDHAQTSCVPVTGYIENVEPKGGMDPVKSTFEILDDKPDLNGPEKSSYPIMIRKEVRLTAGATCEIGTVTSNLDNQSAISSKWCKPIAARNGESPGGTFISYGANGRGGQVKILRPPPVLKVGSSDLSRPVKRMKPSRAGVNQHGALQIEHFFCGAK